MRSDRVAVVGEALEHVGRRGEHGFVVAAPLALAAVERGAAADGDEDVLQRGAAAVVRVHVARSRSSATSSVSARSRSARVAARVAALVRTLQLDEEAVAAERVREPRCCVRVAHREAVARAAGEADEPFVQLLEQLLVERRRQRLAVLLRRVCACAAVSSRQRFA